MSMRSFYFLNYSAENKGKKIVHISWIISLCKIPKHQSVGKLCQVQTSTTIVFWIKWVKN